MQLNMERFLALPTPWKTTQREVQYYGKLLSGSVPILALHMP